MKSRTLCLALLSALVIMAGCGGGSGNGGPPPPPPPPTITSVTVSPQSVSLTSSETQQFSATVKGTGNFNPAVTWSASGGTITVSGLYTAPSVTEATNFTVTAKSVEDTTKSGSATVVVDPQPIPPTITISPSSANVSFGGSQDYVFTVTGVPAPTVTWALSGAGSLSVSGNTVTLSVPNVQPQSFLSTITGTATNSAGQASASATANLVAQIQAVPLNNFFCGRECNATVTLTMTGAFAGVTAFNSSNGNILSLQLLDATHLKVTFKFDASHFNPGFFEFWATEPAPGGGDSNHAHFAFLGNLETMTVSQTNAFQFDYAKGLGYKYDLSGNLLLTFSAGGYGVAFDDTTSDLAITAATVLGAFRSSDGGLITSWTNSKSVMGVAAKSGEACFSQDVDGWLSEVDLTQTNPPGPITSNKSIGSVPWNVAMTTLPTDGLVCAVYTAGDTTLSVAGVPAMDLKRFVPLSGLTAMGQLPQFQGGWQLVVFDPPGPAAGKAALLSQFDKKLIRVDLATGKEIWRVALDGPPFMIAGLQFRIAANNADGSVVVALADIDAGLTSFARVASDGTAKLLATTAPFLSTGLAVSSDGTKLFVANRDKFQVLDNN